MIITQLPVDLSSNQIVMQLTDASDPWSSDRLGSLIKQPLCMENKNTTGYPPKSKLSLHECIAF
jgi:hypothetical protein